MKEFSVDFYKKLIVTVFAILVIAILVFVALMFTEKKTKPNSNGEENQTSISDEEKVPKDSPAKENLDGQEKQVPNAEKSKEQIADGEKDKEQAPDSGKSEKGTLSDGKQKIVYLTFEDSPTKNTDKIIHTLKKNQVNATFFFNTDDEKQYKELMKKAFDNGNAIGVFTSDEDSYLDIYTSVDIYKKDCENSLDKIEAVTGTKPSVLRFPGGSKNSFNVNTRKDIFEFVESLELEYYDWNVCDNSMKVGSDLYKAATNYRKDSSVAMILLHDNGNGALVRELDDIIEFYKNQGFIFKVLEKDSKKVRF